MRRSNLHLSWGLLRRFAARNDKMDVELQLYLGGHLSWYDSQKRKRVEVRLAQRTLLTKVLNDLHVPIGEIAVGVVNGNSVFSFDDVTVTNADKVELFPPVGGG